MPGQSVIETPIGSEKEALNSPFIKAKIAALESAGKKVITQIGTGKIILIVVGSALAAGIAVEERIRRRKKKEARVGAQRKK